MMNNEEIEINPLCSLSINIHGDELDPLIVTKILGVQPSSSWRRGETHITSRGNKVIRKTGLWNFKPDCRSRDISDHITEFLTRIKIDRSIFEVVPFVEHAEISFFFYGYTGESGIGTVNFIIRGDQWRALSRYGLDVSFELNAGPQ